MTREQDAGGPGNHPPVETVAGLAFHSGFWPNLHHTLYAAAWARRTEAGAPGPGKAGALPAPLDVRLAADESGAWESAVATYDRTVASRDLLFGEGMEALHGALSGGDLDDAAVGPDLRDVLSCAAPVYRAHHWAAHDEANRRWIGDTGGRVRRLAPTVVPLLETLYDEPWPAAPVRVDVVWVGRRGGGYTTLDPHHLTLASGEPAIQEWAAAEVVFHEASHLLAFGLFDAFRRALGEAVVEHPNLWHVVLFYLTGAAVHETLRAQGIDYRPYLYATGLLDRAWPDYRAPVEAYWRPFVEGRRTRERAVADTVDAVCGVA